MTLADLALIVAFWLLLMLLRLPLRVDPAYRGKRRHGADRSRPEPRPAPVVPELLTLEPYPFRVPAPHAPALDDDKTEMLSPEAWAGQVAELEETGPLYVSTWRSNGSRYVEPERTS